MTIKFVNVIKYRYVSFSFLLYFVGNVTGILERRDDTYKEDPELKQFDLGVIACATNNFSLTNKLGEGGFGPVYKVMSHAIYCWALRFIKQLQATRVVRWF